MERNVRVAADMGYLTLPEGVVVPLEELAEMAPERQVILSTGSQGEPNSALSLIAAGEHKYFSVGAGALVILSSRVIPGNERTVGRIINGLYRRGADVLYEDNAFVHVSGHASQEDLKLMLRLTRPKYFLPVHGELRHLRAHAHLAAGEGVPVEHVFLMEDGAALEITKSGASVVAGIPAGRVLVDGQGLGDVGPGVLRDRELLAEVGMFGVAVAIDRDGVVVAGPGIASRGVVYVKENEALIEELRVAVAQAVAAMELVERRDREALSARIRLTVRQFVNQRFQRKPVVLPMILEA
jgi:ribonuclease J